MYTNILCIFSNIFGGGLEKNNIKTKTLTVLCDKRTLMQIHRHYKRKTNTLTNKIKYTQAITLIMYTTHERTHAQTIPIKYES